ncbi:SlyX family protein [Oceanomicrobium pacificus]|uniref:SlyX protein n=1 Tax=Oceanomicrobium pacificus TaxID=2692916 RepID=A0A6B0TUL9_9RHOB|nr:SlyX family protein [Oceanomicrobium pacificus]MXU65288.1 SlyX protein [Oceanomicrobium pacificus]
MSTNPTSRIDDLEIQLAHMARTVDELNEVVTAQAETIARMERRIALLVERAAAQEADTPGSIPLADQKPPHW